MREPQAGVGEGEEPQASESDGRQTSGATGLCTLTLCEELWGGEASPQTRGPAVQGTVCFLHEDMDAGGGGWRLGAQEVVCS